jgi:PadR family transcriptional regulator PadR
MSYIVGDSGGDTMQGSIGEFEQLILLALLRLGDTAYGVTIRREIESRTGRGISSGAVYTTLERLEAKGYVSSMIGEPTPERGGRRKKFYRLEPAGAKALGRSYDAVRRMARGLEPKLQGF